jgi:hypothetical protein
LAAIGASAVAVGGYSGSASALASCSTVTAGFPSKRLWAGAIRVTAGATTAVRTRLIFEFLGRDLRLSGWRIKAPAVVPQPRTGILADAGLIEQLLGGIPNRLERGLAGSIGRIIFLADYTLHFGELSLDRHISRKDLLDFVIAGRGDSPERCTQLSHCVGDALISLALAPAMHCHVQQPSLTDCKARHHIFGGMAPV